MDNCIFCKIIRGEIPSQKVFENEGYFAFRDIHPQAKTHVLVIPKTHVKNVLEADEALLGGLFHTAAQVARQEGLNEGFRLVTNCGKHGAQSVEHLHVHVLGGEQLGEDMRGK